MEFFAYKLRVEMISLDQDERVELPEKAAFFVPVCIGLMMDQHTLPKIDGLKTYDYNRTINHSWVGNFGLILNQMLTFAIMMWAHNAEATGR